MPFETGNQLAKGGARPGSGPKPDNIKRELQQILDEAVPDEHRKDIFVMLATRARSGDTKAAALVLGYIYGKPVERKSHSFENESDSDLIAGTAAILQGLAGAFAGNAEARAATAEPDGSDTESGE